MAIFLKTRQAEDDDFQNEDNVKNLESCQEEVRINGNVQESFQKLVDGLESLFKEFIAFKKKSRAKSQLFAFWEDYVDMVQLMLQFIRAERSGNWHLHLVTTAAITPHFFSMDRPNYSRWLPVYLADMNTLEERHPTVYIEFISGNHAIKRTTNPFSQVSTDMGLEQTINRDSKTAGGIIGISQKSGALERWFLTSHKRAEFTTLLKQTCGIDESELGKPHIECSSSRLQRDEEDVQKLVSTMSSDMISDPFGLVDNNNNNVVLYSAGIRRKRRS